MLINTKFLLLEILSSKFSSPARPKAIKPSSRRTTTIMPSKLESFSSSEYWNERFRTDRNAFDWLLPETCFDDEVSEALNTSSVSKPEILHIGSGTSMLSFHLKKLVDDATQLHNVDFSNEAIEWGMNKERELDESIEDPNARVCMNWSQVSLLSLSSVLSVCQPGGYSLIVDKSTSDAIACGLDVEYQMPFPLSVQNETIHQKDDPDLMTRHAIHPLNVLAIHLALVTMPGARWINLSYSGDRLPFLARIFGPPVEPVPVGYPDPARFWKLVQKKEIQTNQNDDSGAEHVVHRPTLSHFVYILERTTLQLNTPA